MPVQPDREGSKLVGRAPRDIKIGRFLCRQGVGCQVAQPLKPELMVSRFVFIENGRDLGSQVITEQMEALYRNAVSVFCQWALADIPVC